LYLDQVNPQVKGGGNLYVAVKLNVWVKVKVKVNVRDQTPPAKILVDSLSRPAGAETRDRRGA
jgi:hypothetical protein